MTFFLVPSLEVCAMGSLFLLVALVCEAPAACPGVACNAPCMEIQLPCPPCPRFCWSLPTPPTPPCPSFCWSLPTPPTPPCPSFCWSLPTAPTPPIPCVHVRP